MLEGKEQKEQKTRELNRAIAAVTKTRGSLLLGI